MTDSLKIAIAGLGTVGGGTAAILLQDAQLLAARCGRPLELVAVSARSKTKNRGVDLSGVRFVDDPLQLPELADVVVEVIGGAEGVARALVEKSLSLGKHVVTANKALIAHHGLALAKLAEKHGVVLAFEAAVAGGIPIIKGLRDGLAANRFSRVIGILNGTCNYILTEMEAKQCSFESALKDAQLLGYAEADPSFDIDGVDTAHKLAILSSLAFGSAPAIDKVEVQGIRQLSSKDMAFAKRLGYRIKLLGIAASDGAGISQCVQPTLVPLASPLANVHGVYNAVVVEGAHAGTMFFEGRGAGAGPTASSVVADIMDIARGARYHPFTLPAASLAAPASSEAGAFSYYLRLSVLDQSGVLAAITHVFKEHGVSVRSLVQEAHSPNQAVDVVIATHAAPRAAIHKALTALAGLPSIKEPPVSYRIEEL